MNKFGEEFRLTFKITRSVRFARDRYNHYREMYLETNHDGNTIYIGKPISVDAILKVY